MKHRPTRTDIIQLATIIAGIVVWGVSISYFAKALQEQVDSSIERTAKLEARIVGKSPEGWHRKHMFAWCKEFERVNSGAVCPDPYEVRVK